MLSTKYVYVDTNQWRAISFDWKNELAQTVRNATQTHRMTLLMTEILDREMTALIDRDITAYVEVLKKAETRRAFSWGDVESAMPNINFGDLKNRLRDQLQQQKARYFSQCKPKWLHPTGATLGAVLKTYFESKLPFEDKTSKKSEFPDAIALQMLMDWCEENGSSAYVVSADQGVKDACLETDCLLPLDTLSDLIREMNLGTEDDNALKRVLTEHNAELAEEIADRLMEVEPYLADEHEDHAEILNAEVEILKVDLLLRPTPDSYRAIVKASARIEVAAFGDDYRYYVVDPSGDRAYSQKREIHYTADVGVDFMVSLYMEDEGIRFEWVQPVGALYIELAANWADGEPFGPVRAYPAGPPGHGDIPF